MKKLILISSIILLPSLFLLVGSSSFSSLNKGARGASLFAQLPPPPEGINYQAVARDTTGKPISNISNLVVKFSIWSDTLRTNLVFTEIHSPVKTNRYGLFTLVIGSVETDSFQNIVWAIGDKFLEVEIATIGGSDYTPMGLTQLMSVPYALYAKSAGNNWSLQGNTANDTNFIGTINAKDFVVKTSNIARMTVKAGGNIGIGTITPNPAGRLDVKGLGNTSSTFGFGVRNSDDVYSMAVRDDGNVGIGTSSPSALFSVGAASPFQVDSLGAIVTATGIVSSGTIRFAGLSQNGIVRTTGNTGTLSSSGGQINLGSEVTDTLPVANGGTGLGSLGNWQAFYSNGIGALTPFSLGAAGTVFHSNGSAIAPTWVTPSSLMQNLSNGTGITAFTYNGAATATVNIANTGITAGTYGSSLIGQALTIPSLTVNAQGQLTAISSTTVIVETPLTFNNGLTRTANNVQLGGVLTQNTTITSSTFNTLFDLNNSGNFRINDNTGTPAFFISPTNGNVGIGTTSPGARLDVSTSVVNIPGIMSIDDGGARIFTVPELSIGGYNPMSSVGDIGLIYNGSGGQNTGSLMIGQWSGSARGIKIDATGNVGIGTVAPAYKLDVAGDVNLTGALRIATIAGTTGQVLTSAAGGANTWTTPTIGTVTSISVVSANGLAGTVANATTTPAITLTTTQTGMLRGNGTAINGVTGTQWGATFWSNTNTIGSTLAGIAGQVLKSNGAAAPTWQTDIGTIGAALTGVNDANVTLVLLGAPATSLLQATSLTLGWAGQLSIARGGTGSSTAFTPGSVVFAGASGVYNQNNANFFWDNTNNRLGIGTTAPTSMLSVGLTSQFQVNSSGAIATAAGIISSGVIQFSGLATGVVKSTAGILSSAAVNLASTDVTGILPIARGGTNISTIGTAGAAIFSNGTQHASTLVGTAGQVLTSAGTGTPTWTTPAAGTGTLNYLARWTSTTALGTGATFDNGTNVGIGTTLPLNKLQIGSYTTFDAQDGGSATTDWNQNLYYNGGWKYMNTAAGTMVQQMAGNFNIWSAPSAGGPGTPAAVSQIFTVLNNGNVGIGTTTPFSKLDVEGGISIGAAYAGSTAAPSDGAIIEGNVGIGTASPTAMLSVGATNQFQVNSTGNIVMLNNVTTSFPNAQGAASTALTNDGFGNLSWAAAAAGPWTRTGTNIYQTTLADNVGIGITAPTSTLQVIGSTASAVLIINNPTSGSITTNTLSAANSIVIVTGVAGTFSNLILPSASSAPGRIYYIKRTKTSGAVATVSPTVPDTLEGETVFITIDALDGLIIVSDGVSGWHVVWQN